jgi:hypothetical protein
VIRSGSDSQSARVQILDFDKYKDEEKWEVAEVKREIDEQFRRWMG